MEENNIYIGQAAEILNCSKSLLRFYEEEFNINIPRNSSGRRVFGKMELDQFRYIYRLKENGYNNAQIKSILSKDKDDSEEEEVIQNNKTNDTNQKNLESIAILELIKELKNDIENLKQTTDYKDNTDLIKENEELKRKLKEKTYELVETREKLTNLKKYGNKRMFK